MLVALGGGIKLEAASLWECGGLQSCTHLGEAFSGLSLCFSSLSTRTGSHSLCRVDKTYREQLGAGSAYTQYVPSCFLEQTPGAELELSQQAVGNHAAKFWPS